MSTFPFKKEEPIMLVTDTTAHPDQEKLRAFIAGRLDADEAAGVEEHLSQCDACCLLLEDSPEDSFLGKLREADFLPFPDTEINPAGWTPTPAEQEPGELSGHPRYHVLRLLGQGGMGAVYLAEHRHMGRSVALKVINPDLLNHHGALSRFQQEVRAAAKLDHPNIVAAFDADHAGSLHFLVMEHVEGQNLADYLAEKGPLPVAEACNIIRQAALGLHHAHERGMVHRDIKPHNLMLTPSNQVKVLDFGLARFAADPIQSSEVSKSSEVFGLTGPGTVVGTTDYIAPEQARDAHGADGRADIYSLGCSLYHLLTGNPPFPEGSALEKLRRHAREEPYPLCAQRTDVPDALAAVVSRMMAKKPEDRYQSAAEVAAALDEWGRILILPSENGRIGVLPHKARGILFFLVGLAAMVLSGLVAHGVVRLPAGPDREIEIKTDDPNIEVVVKGDRIVRIIDPKTGKAYQLDRQDLTLSLADDPDGLSVTLDGKRPIQLKRHGKQIAVVRLAKKGEASASKRQQAEPQAAKDFATGQQVSPVGQKEEDVNTAFFNGKNLVGWRGLPGYWKVHNGAIVGAPPGGGKRHTFLCSEKTYRDFELKFKVKRKRGIGNSGVQIRSTLVCSKQFVVTGPQIEIDSANFLLPPGSIVMEPKGSPFIKSDAAAVAKVWKDDGFNDMTIRCEGKCVIVTINGVEVLTAYFPSMAAEGIIAWQLHGGSHGITPPEEVIFKDIHFRELKTDQVRGPRPAERKHHHFLDSTNWHGLKQFWTMKDGVIKGASGLQLPESNTFLCSRRTYKDFELRFQVRLTGQGWAGNSGVQIRSTLIDPDKFIVRGPQCDIGQGYWGCLWNEGLGLIKQASWEIGDRKVKEGQLNEQKPTGISS
jgi:serine/threonine protein kinase